MEFWKLRLSGLTKTKQEILLANQKLIMTNLISPYKFYFWANTLNAKGKILQHYKMGLAINPPYKKLPQV